MQAYLTELIQKHKLTRLHSELLNLASDTIEIYTTPVSADALPLGASKFGGLPDLPPDVDWPQFRGRYLTLVAQINLAEMNEAVLDDRFPHAGILYFFYDLESWGFDPADRGSARVIHIGEDLTRINRREAPEHPKPRSHLFGLIKRRERSHTFKACKLSFRLCLTLPDFTSLAYEAFKQAVSLTEEEEDQYADLLNEIGAEHRLLGYSEPVQNDMQLECQLVTNGVNCGGTDCQADPRANSLKSGAADWRLLLQVSEDSNSDMMWGDLGMIYFWIREDDLRDQNFDNCWLIFQCH